MMASSSGASATGAASKSMSQTAEGVASWRREGRCGARRRPRSGRHSASSANEGGKAALSSATLPACCKRQRMAWTNSPNAETLSTKLTGVSVSENSAVGC